MARANNKKAAQQPPASNPLPPPGTPANNHIFGNPLPIIPPSHQQLPIAKMKLPKEPDTKGIKGFPQWNKIEPLRFIAPLLHLQIGLLNKGWSCFKHFIDQEVELLPVEEVDLKTNVMKTSDEIEKITTEQEYVEGEKSKTYKLLIEARKKLKELEKNINRKQPRPSPDELATMTQSKTLIDTKIQEYEEKVKDCKEELIELKNQKKTKRSDLTKLNDKLKIHRKKRLGDKDGLDTYIDQVLGDVAKIYPQAFHSGEMNGVCCKRFLNNIEEIMIQVRTKSLERLAQEDEDDNDETQRKRCSVEKLTKMVDEYTTLFQVMDIVFATLRIPAPTDEEVQEAKEAIFVLETLWRNLSLVITPKAHVLFEHTVEQFENFGGIADKVEDFVEKAHQEGKRLEHLTSRMPKQCYRQMQLVQIQRMWIQNHPKIQERIKKVHTSCKRSFQCDREETHEVRKKRLRLASRVDTKQKAFYVDLLVKRQDNNVNERR